MIIIIMMINAIAHSVYKLDGKNKTRIILNNETEDNKKQFESEVWNIRA